MKKIVALWDKVALCYKYEQVVENTADVVRQIQTLLKSEKDSVVKNFPDDFRIDEIAIYVEESKENPIVGHVVNICEVGFLKETEKK